jgi:RNA polymerase sigma-70 factor (ECF subfamily)
MTTLAAVADFPETRPATARWPVLAGLDAAIAHGVSRLLGGGEEASGSRGSITIPRPEASRAARMATAANRSDESLLSDYMAGDRGAFASLVERYRRELHGFLARFLGSNAAADDVFQETFLQVHVAAHTFDRDRTFKPWLFTIAANKARDWHRRQKRRRMASLDAPLGSDGEGGRVIDLMESGESAPEASLEGAEMRARVKDVVDGMPAIYREVLQLNYFQRMSYQQISEVLGIPLGTVKSRIHAATATFAEQWKAAARRSRGGDADKEFKA